MIELDPKTQKAVDPESIQMFPMARFVTGVIVITVLIFGVLAYKALVG